MFNLNTYCTFRRTTILELRNKFICTRYRCSAIPNPILLILITLIIFFTTFKPIIVTQFQMTHSNTFVIALFLILSRLYIFILKNMTDISNSIATYFA